MKHALMIIAPVEFRDEEYFETKKILEQNNIKTTTASTHIGEAESTFGKKAKIEISIEQAISSDFDAIVFIGGGGASIFLEEEKIHELARKFFSENKLTAAICMAPSILANAGILKNKKATAYPNERSNLKKHGALFQEQPVVVDENIITANGPSSSKAFGKAIAEALK